MAEALSNVSFPVPALIIQRGHAHDLLKMPVEIRNIIKATFITNIRERIPVFFNHTAGMAYPYFR